MKVALVMNMTLKTMEKKFVKTMVMTRQNAWPQNVANGTMVNAMMNAMRLTLMSWTILKMN